MSELYAATRMFDYGPPNTPGETLDPGQIVELGGWLNDDKLIRLNLVKKIDGRSKPCQCGKCGKQFAAEFFLSGHGNKRHRGLTAKEQLDVSIAEDKKMDTVMPLHLDKTAATRGRRKRA